MKIVDVVQRTPEWERWRAQGVTASEAAIVLGRSPYKTPWRLWAERTGIPSSTHQGRFRPIFSSECCSNQSVMARAEFSV